MPISYDAEGNIKRPNKEIAFTKVQVEDFVKCAQDVIYFAEKHYYIVHPVQGSMKIKLYDFQKEILDNLANNRFNILLTARQMGKCFFRKGKISVKDDETGEEFEIPIGDFFDLLDEDE